MASKNIPVLVLQNIVLFPSVDVTLEFDKKSDYTLFINSEKYFNGRILIVNKEDILEETTNYDELLEIGVLAKIIGKFTLPNGKIRITLSGIKRVKIEHFYKEDKILHAKYSNILTNEIDSKEEIAYLRMIKNLCDDYINNMPYSSNAILDTIRNINDLATLTDVIVAAFDFDIERKEEYILETNVIERSKMLIADIKQDLEIVELERVIDEKVSVSLNKEQKNIVLREKLNVIKKELGEDKDSDIDNIRKRIEDKYLPEYVIDKINKEIKKLESYSIYSQEVGLIKNYIDLLLDLPWGIYEESDKDLGDIEKSLNDSHYGLNEVKERIIDYIALKKFTDKDNSPIICLVGPPGVGKTTLAISIANSLGLKYVKASVGGVNDEADIVGHRKTYVGAMPGMIINGLKKVGTSNPVFIIDEIDKMTKSIKGDPVSSLLEVLDKEQNNKFVDHYLEEEYDLSKVMFITTANYIENIPYELLDRLEIIEVNSYSKYEKFNIAKDYLIKNAMNEYGISNVKFDDDAINYVIDNYTKEAGVRELNRKLQTILRKVIREKLTKKDNEEIIVNKELVKKYLGEKIIDTYVDSNDIGVVNGLSYTPFGGDVLKIESAMFNGSGEVILTGSLGDVIKESALLALNYIKSNKDLFGVNTDILKNKNIHIHFPEGAIKKDGPSAGIAITTVILSLLLKQKVNSKLAMTGEITLTGNVLPIGGVREKVIGAKNRGVTTIILPKENKKDVKKLDKEITDDLTFIYVSKYSEVFDKIFKVKKKDKNNLEMLTLELN